MGRAFPEGQMTSFAIAGLPMLTTVLYDVRGIEVIIKRAADAKWMERLSRKACAEMGSVASACRAPRTGREIKDHGILYSTSKAIRIGRVVADARRRREDAVAALIEAENGILLFKGKVQDVERRTTEGFLRGTARLAGLDRDRGSTRARLPERIRRGLARWRGRGHHAGHHLHHGQRIGRGGRHRDAALWPAHRRRCPAGA
jgi:DUF917 family protein